MEPRQSDALKEYNRLCQETDGLYHEIALKTGLSDSAFMILYSLCGLGDGCLQRDICRQWLLSKQTVNSSIRKLELAGYLRLSPGRGRDMHIFLTGQGQALVRERILPVIVLENQVFAEMSPEDRAALLGLTRRYTERLRELSRRLL